MSVFRECKVTKPTNRAENPEDAAKLWTESLKMVGLPPKENLNELLSTISNEILPSIKVEDQA